ncbi:partial oxygen-independent coproporphyrinogen III oxidase, partial [Methylococcales bacterium]
RQLGFSSINLDLMYGLPHQTLDSFAKTVDTTIQLSPDRIAVFNYAHLPWLKKHMGLIREEDLPKPEEKLEILKMTIEKLTDAGYVFIGMDHFAKPEDELSIALREKKLYRNFQGYSTHAGTDIYALGITSISQLTNVYAQNEKREKDYFAALDAGRFPVTKGVRLSEDDQLRRWVITRLMCDFELQIPMVEERFGIDFRNYFKHAYTLLPEFAEDDLVQISDHKIEVTERGRMLIRNLAMCFDGYLERKEDKGRYSRTV